MRLELPIAAAVVSLVLSAFLTPQVRRAALYFGAIDRPGARRVHQVDTPRMGGVAVILSFWVAFLGVLLLDGDVLIPAVVGPLVGFGGGAAIIALVGMLDDLKGLGAKAKLLGQFLAAAAAWSGGARIQDTVNFPFWGAVHVGPLFAFLATTIWILAFVNAINLIDGLDGLAGGIVFFATITNLVVAFVTGNLLAALFNAALAGAVLGFLRYNFSPARIFLGDTGSLFLGYALSAGALLSSRQKESTLASLLVVIIALGLPLADTILTMLRRVIRRRSIFSADQEHLHHRLLAAGLTHKRAVLVLYGCTAALSLVAVVAAIGQDGQVGWALLGAILILSGVMRFSGYFRESLGATADELEPQALQLSARIPHLAQQLLQASSSEMVLGALAELFDKSELQAVSIQDLTGRVILAWRSPEAEGGRSEGALLESSFHIVGEERQVGTLFVAARIASQRLAPELRILLHVLASMLLAPGERFGWWEQRQ